MNRTYRAVIQLKLASSQTLAGPGRNITGFGRLNIELTTERLELLNETVPRATKVAVLFNPEGRVPVLALKEAQAAAQRLGLQIQLMK